MTAYDLGYTAYDAGKDIQDNPFHMFNDGHHEWLDGYLAAQEHAYNEGS